MPSVALLQREYEELATLIPVVHPEPVGRMNALEYVKDVVGENEREAVLPEEEISPPPSVHKEPDRRSISAHDETATNSIADDTASPLDGVPDPVVGSTDSPPRVVEDRDGDSQESRIFNFRSPTFSFSDGVHCAQLALDDPGFDWDLNV